MDYEVFIPERIARLRMKSNISATELSYSIGQSRNYISSIEGKHALHSMRMFFSICECLKISPKEFFEADNQNPALLNDLVTILK